MLRTGARAPWEQAAIFVGISPMRTGYGAGDDDNEVTYGAFGGLKFFVGPHGALSTEAFVERTSFDEFDFASFGVRLGISIFF